MRRTTLQQGGKRNMNDFQRGYILAYFKDHPQNYSFHFLAENLGISIAEIDDLISDLIAEKQLYYNHNNMLELTPQGRLSIMNDQIDYFSFKDTSLEMHFVNHQAAVSVNEIYIPDDFISKLK